MNLKGAIIMNNQDFGNFISTLRKEKGLTQKELGEKLNITDKAVSRWENGKNYPDIEVLEPLGAELGVGINELIACERIDDPKKAEIETIKAYYEERNKVRRLKNKIIAIICAFVLLIIALFLPTSSSIMSSDGTTEYHALTYKIIKWNRPLNNENTYRKTSVYFFPESKKAFYELWNEEKIEFDHRDIYVGDIKSEDVSIGSQMPDIIYMNNDIVVIYGTCGVIVYNYNSKTIENRLNQKMISDLGYRQPYAVADADNGKIYIRSFEIPESNDMPLEFDTESNIIRRVEILPDIENYGSKETTDYQIEVDYGEEGFLISDTNYIYDNKRAYLISDSWDMASLKLIIEQSGSKEEYALFK